MDKFQKINHLKLFKIVLAKAGPIHIGVNAC